MSNSEEWTRMPGKSNPLDREPLRGRNDRQQQPRNDGRRGVQWNDQHERRQPIEERTPRQSNGAAGTQHVRDRAPEEPHSDQRPRHASSGNPRGVLRVPHLAHDLSQHHRPRSATSSGETGVSSENRTAVAKVSDAREAETKQLLWSAVVKAAPSPRVQPVSEPEPVPPASPSGDEAEEEGDGSQEEAQKKKKKKKRSKKKKAGEAPPTTTAKRYTQPLVIELGAVLQEAAESRQVKMTVAAGAPLQVLYKKAPLEKTKDEKSIPRNVLDSSAPLVRRGKERESPKKKKPSALKKVITKEKEEKRKLREQGLDIPTDFDVTKQQEDSSKNDPQDHIHSETETKTDAEQNTEVEIKVKAGDHSETEREAIDDHKQTACWSGPKAIHNRMFRNYCDHLVTEEINQCLERLISDLVRFQERHYQKDPIKARARKRYVCGLREVAKHVKLKKLKCVIIPPNLDNIQSTGGLNSIVGDIIGNSRELGIPVIYGLSRRKLAYLLKKKHKVGCLGIFSYDGAETWYKQLVELVGKAREDYQVKVALLSVGQDVTPAEGQEETQGLSSSESGEGSHEEEGEEQEKADRPEPTNIRQSPWSVFFDEATVTKEGNSNYNGASVPKTSGDNGGVAVGECPGESVGHTLNVAAPEFVPVATFKFNVNAMTFTPLGASSTPESKETSTS